jgi:segregation and condensation protein A
MDNTVFKKKLDYNVRIENFEGPLDLLLYLIKEAQNRYKGYIYFRGYRAIPFLYGGFRCAGYGKSVRIFRNGGNPLEIKSNSLLPKIEDVLSDSEDPAQKMIRQLEEYKLFKESCDKLKMIENINRYYKIPDESVSNVKVILKDMNIEGLIEAFSKLLFKSEERKRDIEVPREIQKDPTR